MSRTDKWDWYKRYPAKFIRGVRGLGPEVIGVYAVILDLIYDDEESCPNDPLWIGGILGCSSRKAAALIAALIEKRKLVLTADGRLTNYRALEEIEKRVAAQRAAREHGLAGGRPRVGHELASSRRDGESSTTSNENNSLGKGTPNHLEKRRVEKSREERKEEDGKVIFEPKTTPLQACDLDKAVEAYNEVALPLGWTICKKRNRTRDVGLRRRVADAGGADGWRREMERAGRSPFLRGETKRSAGHENWKPSLDFFLQEKSFTKLVEGGYDPDTRAANGAVSGADALKMRRSWLTRYGSEGAWTRNSSGNGVWQDAFGIGPPPHMLGTLVTEEELTNAPSARAMRDKLKEEIDGRT